MSPDLPPPRPRISLCHLLAPLATLLLGAVLAKHHSGHLHHVTTLLSRFVPECAPPRICPWYLRRAPLPSGRASSRLFDVARRHLHSDYAALPSLSPSTTLLHAWRSPRVVVLDGGFARLTAALAAATDGRFLPTTVVDDSGLEVLDANRVSDTAFVSPHRADATLNADVDRLVRLVGFPGRHYAEVVEVNRYNETGFFALHHDFLSARAIDEPGPFRGCHRVATAVLQLADVPAGGETVFVRDPAFKGPFSDIDTESDDVLVVGSRKGRLLVWFNYHPDTEQFDNRTWHGSMPVTEGSKIAATFYIRNCSQADNSRRHAAFDDFMKEAPSPSIGVATQKDDQMKALLGLDDSDKDGEGDEEADDDDGEDYADTDDDYLEDLRNYREIRDAAGEGNVTERLIEAGFSPDEFSELDEEVLYLDGVDDEEAMEEAMDRDLERLKQYKSITDRGGSTNDFLKAGFTARERKLFDKGLKEFGDQLDTGSDDAREQPTAGGKQEQEQGAHGVDVGNIREENKNKKSAVSEDEGSMRAFQEVMQEQIAPTVDEDDDDDDEWERADYFDEDEVDGFDDDDDDEDGQCGGDGMDDEDLDFVGNFFGDDFMAEDLMGNDDWDEVDDEGWGAEDGAGWKVGQKVIPPGSKAEGVVS